MADDLPTEEELRDSERVVAAFIAEARAHLALVDDVIEQSVDMGKRARASLGIASKHISEGARLLELAQKIRTSISQHPPTAGERTV